MKSCFLGMLALLLSFSVSFPFAEAADKPKVFKAPFSHPWQVRRTKISEPFVSHLTGDEAVKHKEKVWKKHAKDDYIDNIQEMEKFCSKKPKDGSDAAKHAILHNRYCSWGYPVASVDALVDWAAGEGQEAQRNVNKVAAEVEKTLKAFDNSNKELAKSVVKATSAESITAAVKAGLPEMEEYQALLQRLAELEKKVGEAPKTAAPAGISEAKARKIVQKVLATELEKTLAPVIEKAVAKELMTYQRMVKAQQ